MYESLGEKHYTFNMFFFLLIAAVIELVALMLIIRLGPKSICLKMQAVPQSKFHHVYDVIALYTLHNMIYNIPIKHMVQLIKHSF